MKVIDGVLNISVTNYLKGIGKHHGAVNVTFFNFVLYLKKTMQIQLKGSCISVLDSDQSLYVYIKQLF